MFNFSCSNKVDDVRFAAFHFVRETRVRPLPLAAEKESRKVRRNTERASA